jgi:hypothetical protein
MIRLLPNLGCRYLHVILFDAVMTIHSTSRKLNFAVCPYRLASYCISEGFKVCVIVAINQLGISDKRVIVPEVASKILSGDCARRFDGRTLKIAVPRSNHG